MSDEQKAAKGETSMPKDAKSPTKGREQSKDTSDSYRFHDWAAI